MFQSQIIRRLNRQRQSSQDSGCDQASISRKLRHSFVLRRIWIYPICVVVLFFLSEAFVPILTLRVFLSLGLSIFPFQAITGLLYEKRSALLRSQSKVLFQSLCTSVSGGYSLESAFLLSIGIMEKAFGKRSLMANGLHRLEKALSAHVPLSEALEDFCRKLDFIEILPIFHALAISRVVGSGVISILRNSCQMLSELIAVNSEVEANNAGRNAEAFVLCVMPFGITYALSGFSEGYMNSAHSSHLGIVLMLVAFSIAVISCGFLLSLIGGKKKSHIGLKKEKNLLSLPEHILLRIRNFLYRLIPEGTLTRQFEFYSELSSDPNQLFLVQISKTLQFIIVSSCLFTLLFILSGTSLFLLVPAELGIIVLAQFDLRNRVLERREKLMEEIPLFLSMLVTLLNSGVLLPKAIDTCSKAFTEKTHLGNEIRIMKAQMMSGLSAGKTLESFSERTPLPEAQAALLLAARYEITGGAEVLQLLSLQSSACWSLCRNASRKRREREALAMVFPMMLDLVSVLLVAITPALLSLKTF